MAGHVSLGRGYHLAGGLPGRGGSPWQGGPLRRGAGGSPWQGGLPAESDPKSGRYRHPTCKCITFANYVCGR